jgi:hypothetical protein
MYSQTLVESRADANSVWKSYAAEQFSDINDFTPTRSNTNQYGSNTDYKTTATGYFRCEIVGNRWYIIDPEGYIFIHKGVACVSPGTSNKQKAAVTTQWGSNEAWCTYANEWLKSNGFNGAGAWSDITRIKQQNVPVVYTVIINPMSNYRNYHKTLVGEYKNAGWQGYEYNIIRVFDPLFETYMDNACKTLAQYKNDKYLLGYFIDNELPWVNDALDRHIKYLTSNDPCYIAAKEWLDQRKGKNAGLSDITDEDRNAFWDFYAGKFFRMAKSYISKYDPNHMFLGSRFNQAQEELSNPYIFGVAGKSCDIISINHYREWEPIASRMANWENWASKPFMITEFYTKGEDSGFTNTTGAGWLVKTQHDRGLFYENFIIKLLRSKGCVGWNWFRYQDNDPEDPTTDPSNRDSNKGLVNITYTPYSDLINLCKITNDNVYSFLEYLKAKAAEVKYEVTPSKDTYLRLLPSETEVHGKENLIRVKNSSGSTYERTGLLQFELSIYKDQLSKLKKLSLRLKLTGIYPGTNDPKSTTLDVYKVNNMDIEEIASNSQLLTSYPARTEFNIGSTIVPVNPASKDAFFETDISALIKGLINEPVLTLRIQMGSVTETQFEFASRENPDITARPAIILTMQDSQTATAQTSDNNTIVYNKGNLLLIEGIENDSLITIYNIRGQALYKSQYFHETNFSLNTPTSWGNIILVNIIDKNENKTFKVKI